MYVVELHVANSLQTDAEDYFKVNRPEAWLIIDRPRVLWVLSGKIDVNTISTWRANPKCDCVIPSLKEVLFEVICVRQNN